jgi:hypothetical protein
MSNQPSTDQSPLTAERPSKTVKPYRDRRDILAQGEHSGPQPTAIRQPPPSPTPATPSSAGRSRLTTTYRQGDFARGQRTLPLPVASVGTFAAR